MSCSSAARQTSSCGSNGSAQARAIWPEIQECDICPMHTTPSPSGLTSMRARVPSSHGRAATRSPSVAAAGSGVHGPTRSGSSSARATATATSSRCASPAWARFVYIADPALIKQVFAADRDIGLAGEARKPFVEDMLGEQSLLTTDGEQWERQRKLIGPPFHGELIENYRDQIHDIAVADIERWPRGHADPAPPAHAGDHARGDPAARVRDRGRGPPRPPALAAAAAHRGGRAGCSGCRATCAGSGSRR